MVKFVPQVTQCRKGLLQTMFFLSALCVGNMLLNAQVATTYTFSQTTTAYSALTSPTNISTADNATSAITIPFPFAFNGVYYTSVNANTNGYVNFGTHLQRTITRQLALLLWEIPVLFQAWVWI